MASKNIVTAGEIGEYVYCPRGWWLRFKGFEKGNTQAMEMGTTIHNNLSDSLDSFSAKKTFAIAFITIGFLFIVITLFYFLR